MLQGLLEGTDSVARAPGSVARVPVHVQIAMRFPTYQQLQKNLLGKPERDQPHALTASVQCPYRNCTLLQIMEMFLMS